MIFRRIATALKRHDWSAVAIEFALVVAGVLVALQLDTWSQLQDDKVAYAAALDRLEEEIAANLETIKYAEEEIGSELPLVRAALGALETCADDPETRQVVNDGLALISGANGLVQRDSALRELASAPRLLALQSPMARRRIADLLFYLEIVDSEARFYETTPLNARPEIIPVLSPGPRMEIRTSYLGIDYTRDKRVLELNVPVSIACKNTELVAALWAWDRWQSALPSLYRKMREEYRLTTELLSEQKAP